MFMHWILLESAMGVSLDETDIKVKEEYKQAIHNFGYILFYR